MRKYSVLIFLLAFLGLPAVAASPDPKTVPFGNSDRLIVPTDSPVRFSGFDSKQPPMTAAFEGRFLLTGTYYYGDNDFNDSGDDDPSLYAFLPQAYIIPDDDVATRLPRFAIRNRRQTIFISNPSAFAGAVVSKALARRVRCRHCGDVTGHIAIWVDRFTAGIECDNSVYEVRFLSIYKPARLALVPRPSRSC